jgi:[ribosomal protein S5]-alanine N-acetyltransferase
MTFSLVRCDADGRPVQAIAGLSAELEANCVATAELYRRVGYVEPWVGYVAVVDGEGVGGGAFVGPPHDNCVEIAYFTLKDQERRGFASQTAAGLVEIARSAAPTLQLKAFTLMERNASTRILERLGFKVIGTSQDPDAGEVWEWRA